MKRVYFFLATLLGLLSVLPMSGQTITVKAKVPAHWTNTITAWVWETDGDSYDVTPIKEGDWYSYTHTGASFNIIYRNGEVWTNAANQTVDITNIKTNTCFALSQTGAEKAVYTIVDCETGEDITNTDSVFANVLISQSDVELTILNDTLYPWVYDATNACITNSNCGFAYTTSTLSLSYKSDYVTEFQVDWLSRNYSYHQPLQLYIDGVLIQTTSSSSYSTPRFYLPAGEHIITFRDSIGNSSSTNNYSRISNLRIHEILPLDTADFVSYSDVDITIINDSIYPWIHIEGTTTITNTNCGIAYTSSTLSLSYKSDYATEFQVDWLSCSYSSYHQPLQLYIDGVLTKTTNGSCSSYSTPRYYLPAGEHVITFRDSIGNSTYVENYSYIKNLRIREILPFEDIVLTENSQPLTFTNDSVFPWTIEDGYIQSSNYGFTDAVSAFSTSFTIDKPSIFRWTSGSIKMGNNTSGSHSFMVRINNELAYGNKIFLEPGTYEVVFKDSIKGLSDYATCIYSIELSSDWISVEPTKEGMLGVEVLRQVEILQDIELLKIKGNLNADDFAKIKQMTSLVGLDLSEATFEVLPTSAFSSLPYLYDVKLPEGLLSIGESAFLNTRIQHIDIPSTVTSIGKSAFSQTPIQTITFAENAQLQYIGYQAFYQCTRLIEFIMPNTVKNLGYSSSRSDCFYECTALETLHFSDSITLIPEYTCYKCSNLKDLSLPKMLIAIWDRAFYDNAQLRHVVFPETTTSICPYAFRNCVLDTVILPIQLTYLGEYAFYNCDSLRYIELPSHISHYNVNFYDCNGINTIVCPAATPPLIASNPLSNGASKSNITLYVPSFALLNYKLDNYWYGFGEILPMDEDPIDWTIGSDMTLYNDSPIKVEPNVKLTYGEDNSAQYSGSLTVNGNETLSMRSFYIPWSHNNQYVDPDDPKNYCALINNSSLRADSIEITIGNRNDIWTFVTFPYDVKISDITFTYSGSTNYVIRKYDGQKRADGETNSTWVLLSQEDTLHAGVGYIMQSSRYVGSEWQYYSGFSMPAINNTNKNKIFINTDATVVLNEYQSEFAHNRGWNLIGNPYPSYYDTRFMDFNAPITIWDMDNSTYRAYSPLDDEYILCPGEAFFVQCPVDNRNIVFSKEGRQINRVVRSLSALPAKKQFTGANASRTVINLALSDGEHTDKTRVVLNENATVQYDMDKDASKFMSEDANIPQLYTTYNDVQYAINERPFADGVVDLCTRISTSGTYTITLQNNINDYTIYLLDKKLNQTTLLSEHIGYSFVATAGESVGRFELHFKSNTTTDLEQTTNNNISPEDGDIYTIMGVQVKQATAPGMYIQNGKKFIVQ